MIDLAYEVSKVLSMGLFLYYGLSVLTTDAMVSEFERFGLSRFRRLTGGLEVLGGVGLAAGYVAPSLVGIASGGLAALMVLGIATRIRVRDPLVQIIPALVLAVVNLFILVRALDLGARA